MISRPAIKFGILMLAFVGAASMSENSMLHAVGLQNTPWLVFTFAFVIAALTYSYNWRYVAVVVVTILLANLPPETAQAMGYHRDYLVAALIALVFTPYITEMLE